MDLLAHLHADSARFRDALAEVDPTAQVPSCPDWNSSDLLWHLTGVQAFFANLLEKRSTEKIDPVITRAADPAAAVRLFDGWSQRLLTALAGVAPDTRIYTWHHDHQNARFVLRRQAHEALIHRVDAELTAGLPSDVDAQLAADGVLEVMDWQVGHVPEWGAFTPTDRTTAITCSDTGDRVLVRHGTFNGTHAPTQTVYTDLPFAVVIDQAVATGEPDAEVSGPAAALDVWLWGRGDDTAIDGDETVKSELRALVVEATGD